MDRGLNLSFLTSSATSTTTTPVEKLVKDVSATAATSMLRHALFDTFLSVLVIDVSLLRIHECLIGNLEVLEDFFVTTFIRMRLHCLLPKRLLDLVRGSILLHL
jgi:hypothetical protein